MKKLSLIITGFILFIVLELWGLAELIKNLGVPFLGQCIMYIATLILNVYTFLKLGRRK